MQQHHPIPPPPHNLRHNSCKAYARPNFLLFEDDKWCDARTAAQLKAYRAWLQEQHATQGTMVIFEIGAGTAIPTGELARQVTTPCLH